MLDKLLHRIPLQKLFLVSAFAAVTFLYSAAGFTQAESVNQDPKCVQVSSNTSTVASQTLKVRRSYSCGNVEVAGIIPNNASPFSCPPYKDDPCCKHGTAYDHIVTASFNLDASSEVSCSWGIALDDGNVFKARIKKGDIPFELKAESVE